MLDTNLKSNKSKIDKKCCYENVAKHRFLNELRSKSAKFSHLQKKTIKSFNYSMFSYSIPFPHIVLQSNAGLSKHNIY